MLGHTHSHPGPHAACEPQVRHRDTAEVETKCIQLGNSEAEEEVHRLVTPFVEWNQPRRETRQNSEMVCILLNSKKNEGG